MQFYSFRLMYVSFVHVYAVLFISSVKTLRYFRRPLQSCPWRWYRIASIFTAQNTFKSLRPVVVHLRIKQIILCDSGPTKYPTGARRVGETCFLASEISRKSIRTRMPTVYTTFHFETPILAAARSAFPPRSFFTVRVIFSDDLGNACGRTNSEIKICG